MKRTSLFDSIRVRYSRPHKPKRTGQSRRLRFEGLEPRQVLSTLILVDFDGATREELRDISRTVGSSSDIRTRWDGTLENLRGLTETFTFFNSQYSQFRFLDFNGDRVLDGRDADEAARRVVDAVQENFAPYNVLVLREDSTNRALEIMAGSAANDALVLVSGPYLGVGGQAPIDPGNRHDNAANVGAALGIATGIRDSYLDGYLLARERATAFINQLANLVSHEAGHTFGLEHISVEMPYASETDPRGRSLMTHAQGWRNASFADYDYLTDDFNGDWSEANRFLQNEHRYLTTTLGPSPDAWAAVLRAGVLTIQGSRWNDVFDLTVNARGDWIVTDGTSGRQYYVAPAAQPHSWERPTVLPEVQSMNQYGYPISSIVFVGGAGDDWIRLSQSITASLAAFGGEGNDHLYGGGGNDLLYGVGGNDVLYGGFGDDLLHGDSGDDFLNGDAGNDELLGRVGNDTLRGGDGSDRLDGGSGHDRLFGNGDDDWLFGDYGVDFLFGGDGNDVLDGAAGDDHLFGGLGDDALSGGLGDDFLYGGAGHDLLYGDDGNDYLAGEAGRDWLHGGGDDDRLYGGSGGDNLFGDDGNDYLDGGEDNERDVLVGGAGSDTSVKHYSRTLIYDPLTGLWVWSWHARDRLLGYDPAVDLMLTRYEA